MGLFQKLKKGVALSGSNFPDFVETWNWLVDFVSNLKGDADLSPKTGGVKIDRSNPNNPVIRLVDGGEIEDNGPLDVSAAELMQREEAEADDPELVVKKPNEKGGFDVFRLPIGLLSNVGSITIKGTDGNSVTGKTFVFASEDDSNITVKATVDENGVITCKFGVYWARN